MKLELDPLDLRPKFQKDEKGRRDQGCPTSAVTFDKLKAEAQSAVRAVGKATFYAWDRMTYNAVYPSEVTR